MPDVLAPRLRHVACAHPGGLHRLAYHEWFDASRGDPRDAPVAVCVHGLTRRGSDFDPLARVLAARGWRVVCPDMPGRGDSDRLANPMGYVVPQYVADCVTLVARLGAEKVDWIGTSMGGLIGMSYASLAGHPIRRMVLNDIGPELAWSGIERIAAYVGMVPEFDDYAQGERWVRERMVTFGPHDDAGWDLLVRPYLAQRPDGRWTAHYDPAIAVPFQALVAATSTPGAVTMWAEWDAIDCPVLALRGAESDLLSPDTCAGMASRGPRARIVEFPGVGHAPTLIDPAQIAPIVDFLSA